MRSKKTMTARLLPSAVDDALRYLPVELSRLIIDYLSGMPHEWTSFEEVDVVPTIGNEAEIRSFDRSVSNRWRMLVSSNCFRTGYPRWTIDLPIGRWQRNGRIGVGVTMSVGNNNLIDHPSSELDWMLFLQNNDCLAHSCQVMHNGQILESKFFDTTNVFQTTELRVEFEADLVVGSVLAYVSQKINGLYRRHADPIWLFGSSPTADFSLLRPCVALAGQITIAFRSG